MVRLVFLLSVLLSLPSAGAADFKCLQRVADLHSSVQEAIGETLGVRPLPESCTTILLNGAIEPGDALRLEEAFRVSRGLLSAVDLNSPGGSISEAIAIGRFIRKALMQTNSAIEYFAGEQQFPPIDFRGGNPCKQSRCICASACFVIWAAGMNRSGHALAIHRPRFDRTYFAGLDIEEAQREYRTALAELAQYFQEMDIPADYYVRMMNTPSADMHTLPRDEVEALWTLSYPPAVDEWLISKCGAYPKSKIDALLVDLARSSPREPAAYTDKQRQTMMNSWAQIGACRSRVIIQTRYGLYKGMTGER